MSQLTLLKKTYLTNYYHIYKSNIQIASINSNWIKRRYFVSNLQEMASKSALVIIANGSEEMEAVITIDTLRRAGIDVTVAGLNNADLVKCSRNVVIKPDASLNESVSKTYDIVILPGGLEGSKAFCASDVVGNILKQQESSGRYIGAICAAPTALKAHSIAVGKKLTCYPSMAKEVKDSYEYKENDVVVVDGKLITSQGPGTAYQFALKIIDTLLDKEKASSVAKGMLLTY